MIVFPFIFEFFVFFCGYFVLLFILRGCASLCQRKRHGAADQRANRKGHFRADGRAHEESAREQRRFGRLLLSFASAREKVLQLWAGKRSGGDVGTHDYLYWIDDQSIYGFADCLLTHFG